MSTNNSKELSGLSKYELTLLVSIIILMIFSGAIVYLFTVAKIDFSISGNLDVNTIMTVFIGIVMSVIAWLGISRTRPA